jgi:hypothetical protein
MNPTAIRTALRTALQAIVPADYVVRWREDPQQFGERFVTLYLSGLRGVGTDEILEELDLAAPHNQEFTPHQTGQRTATLQIRVDSPSQFSGNDAFEIIHRIRDSIYLPGIEEITLPSGFSFGTILSSPIDLSETKDGRRASVFVMDISVNTFADSPGIPYGYIGSVDLTTKFKDPAGTVTDVARQDYEV